MSLHAPSVRLSNRIALTLTPVLCLVGSLAAHAQSSQPKIEGIHQAMAKFVDEHVISGAVTAVGSSDGLLHLDTVGQADLASERAMQPDTIFWIASMTKPITGAAIGKLQEQGKLSLNDPVSKYIPEFKDLKDVEGNPVEVTILQLLTHTSGMADPGMEKTIDIPNLEGLIPLYVSEPVQFEPGSRWKYCQSSINTAGRIVEILSGMPFEEYLEKEFFEPLGMQDTTFYLSEEQMSRLATPYNRTEDGELEETENIILQHKSPMDRDRYPAANGGLYSTAPDYLKFARMLLNKGTLDGRQYLKPETVELLTTVHTGDLVTGFTPGMPGVTLLAKTPVR